VKIALFGHGGMGRVLEESARAPNAWAIWNA
jgi:hypothetical protein